MSPSLSAHGHGATGVPSSNSASSSSSEDAGIIYGLEFQCRAMAAVEGKEDAAAFYVGTQGMNLESNQIHLVTLLEEDELSGPVGTGNGGMTKDIYAHPKGEVWQIVPDYNDPNRLITRHSGIENNICKMEATLWSRAPSEDAEQEPQEIGSSHPLYPLCSLSSPSAKAGDATPTDITHVAWMPGSNSTKVMVLSENRLSLQDVSTVEDGAAKVVSTGKLDGKGYTNFYTGTWNPHQNSQQFATVNEHTVRGWDVRSMEQAWTFDSMGSGVVRSLDFNPNKQYHLATAGDDGCARFWDLRSATKPLAVRDDHSHWIWCLRFNQFHDQLVLTSSSDSHVVLSCMASISSEPHGHIVEDDEDDVLKGQDESPPPLDDGVLKKYEDHEESVYMTAWSSADPWTFASLSYDGRLVINRVPRLIS